jgi:kinesin family member 22
MSNAGKTHTIEGTSTSPGMLPLLANKLLDRLLTTTSSSAPQLQFSMLQIYNEKMTDLLHSKKKVTIRDRNGEVDVGDLTYHPLATPKEALKLITKGLKNRSSGFTVVNNTSSRSHGVYAFTLGSDSFYIIDLAGAERKYVQIPSHSLHQLTFSTAIEQGQVVLN